jgi:hypothetical protein
MDIGSLGMGFVVTAVFALQAAWYIGVVVMLLKIWKKERHLPG